jgi:hypothetical protein
VSKTELPRDSRGEDLDYDRLISTLESVVGESVVVRLSTREVEGDRSLNVASAWRYAGDCRGATADRREPPDQLLLTLDNRAYVEQWVETQGGNI